jgi:hypothetical protein
MLADEERSLSSIKQIAMTRQFDLKQATEVVRIVADTSPFDKVCFHPRHPCHVAIDVDALVHALALYVTLQLEAAVILYGSLLNKASFPTLLQEFDDPADRDNVCHRLGLVAAPDGTLVPKKKGHS